MIPDADVLRPLVAGWIAGAAAGLFITPVLVVWAARPGHAAWFRGRSWLPVLVILFLNGLGITLTLAGLLLGAVYSRSGGPGFGAAVVAGLLVLAALYLFVRRRWRTAEAPVVLASAVILALAFGGLLPWLAERG